MLVDSHAHLDDTRFDSDREDAIARAREAGVGGILTIGNGAGPGDMGCGLPLARSYSWIYTTVGIHPHDAARAEPAHFAMMEDLASDENVRAIGEAGLDYHYDNSPRPVQREVFCKQLELANRVGLPIVIHTRQADADTIALLGEVPPGRGVVHCFTGGRDLMDCALDLGLMISISGILTFPRSESLRDLARCVPDDRLLIETDAPYLAPAPHRGKRNEPAFVAGTAGVLAALRGVSAGRLAEQTTANFERLFGVAL